MPHRASSQRSCAAYVSIIAFGMEILMINAKWRKYLTIARRMEGIIASDMVMLIITAFYVACASIIAFRVTILIRSAL